MASKTILIVDLNPGVLMVAKNALSRADYEVIVATTVDEGTARAGRFSPELLIIDGFMQGAGDFAWSSARRMSIILTAPKGCTEDLRAAIGTRRWQTLSNVALILEKPLASDTLVAAVNRALMAKRTAPVVKSTVPAKQAKPAKHERRVVPAALLDNDVTAPARESDDPTVLTTEVVRSKNPHDDILIEPLLPSRTPKPPRRSSKPAEGAQVADLHAFHTQRTGAFAALLAESASRPAAARMAYALSAPYPRSPSEPSPETAAALFTALSEVFDDAPEALATELTPLPEVAEDKTTDPPEETPRPELSGRVVAQGRLGTIRIDQILQLAADANTPTCVRFETEHSAIDVFFEESAVIYGRRHQPADWDALDLWIDEKLSDPAQADQGGSTIGREAELAVFEAIRWTEARYTITEGETVPELVRNQKVRIPLMPLILEGARRLDEWRRIAGEISSRSAVPGRIARADEARVLAALSPEQRRILEEVDGRRNVEELVRSVQRPPLDVLKALRRLRDERLVTLIHNTGSA